MLRGVASACLIFFFVIPAHVSGSSKVSNLACTKGHIRYDGP